jgi:hypothetical protein
MNPLRELRPGDNALSVDLWNGVIERVNYLSAVRGEGTVVIHKSDANIVVEGSGGARDGLTSLDPELRDFIHVGLNVTSGGEIGAQQIRNWTDSTYDYLDAVGEWQQWYANQNNDFVWRLRLRPRFDYRIKRVELYQVFESPSGVAEWSTGQAWATQFEVKPFDHQGGSNPFLKPDGSFEVFPLAIWKNGSPRGSGERINTDYSSFLSSEVFNGFQTKTFYLSGDANKFASLSHYFRVMIFLENANTGAEYRVVRGTISTAATNPQTEL